MLVSPRPGTNPGDLLTTLRSVHTGAVNARGIGGTSVDVYNCYLRWAVESARALRQRISGNDLDALVLTRRYWALQTLAAPITGHVGDLVAIELDERVESLDAAVKALAGRMERWSRPGTFVVADTSFFLSHGDKLEEVDFRPVLGIREEAVHLLVPMVVVDELDNLKRASQPKLRWRAGYTLAVLDRVLQDPAQVGVLRAEDFSALETGGIPRGQVTVEVVFDAPGHVRLPINDDEIIDRAASYQVLAGRPVHLVTYDTHQSMAGRTAGLKVIKLDQKRDEQEPPAA